MDQEILRCAVIVHFSAWSAVH